MKPTVVLIGRPNVGKSTLFNRLTRTRAAIVADMPGLTRDRHYGHGRVGDRPYLVVDTGGLEPAADAGILAEMARQTRQAVDEADAVVFLVDARDGLTPHDRLIADELRRSGRPVTLVVNKAEGLPRAIVAAEFHELGLGEPWPISAAHGEGVRELMELVLAPLPLESAPAEEGTAPKIAVVGRPNAGKSTLVNSLLGAERVIAFDQPGTTRDSIHIDFEHDGRPYTLIDTAGLRRRGKVFEAVEKFSVIKTLQAIEEANVAVLVLDAKEGVSEQDAHIADFIVEAGRALVVAVNKWDALDGAGRERFKQETARTLKFLEFARFHHISALAGTGVPALLRSIDEAYASAHAKLPTPQLTRLLAAAVAVQAPPKGTMFRPKLRYAHQGGSNPPLIVIHGNALDQVSDSYRRYLERTFRDAFKLRGTPLKVQFKGGHNPFATKKPPPLTPRQERKARRERRYGRKTFGRS
ncbi:MAG: ribosome biogenesis GTPase Der [Betaproteobacteria bacterium]|nr:ribosome biogenesis GTPase Der [Betaproteobacteria bacterium]